MLRQAELEESELAKIDTEVAKALGKWAVVRLRADERRRLRMARGLLTEFVEREEGALGGEACGREEDLLLVLAGRVRRMRRPEGGPSGGDADAQWGGRQAVAAGADGCRQGT